MFKSINFKNLSNIKINNRFFLVIILALVLIYNFQETCFLKPQGLHQWRQCVGASYAMNYYNNDLDITQLRIYNHLSDNATSDFSIADFPILYYIVAVCYSIFGNSDSIFRIINALIMLSGLYFLMLSSYQLLKDRFWSFFIPVILFTSPTLVYYSNGFLPDTTAFGIVFIALYFVVKYIHSKKISHIYWASFLFTLAGLIKVTSLMSFLAISGTLVLMYIFSTKIRKEFNIYKFILPILLPIFFVLLWNFIVYRINSSIGGTISDTNLRPIWDMDALAVEETWNRIQHRWLNSYFHISVQLTALAMFISSLIFFKKSMRVLTIITSLTLIGSLFFFFAFFRSLYAHDYDLINIFVLIIFGLVSGLILLKNYFPKVFRSNYLKIAAMIWVSFLVIECNKNINIKFHGYHNYSHKHFYHGLQDIEKTNRNLGIQQNDLVISIPDPSINITLYLMNQPGFTDFGLFNKSGTERIDYFIKKNAKYLIINDTSIYSKSEYDYLQPYLVNKIGQHRNIGIFDLRNL
jgi:hypothetical protein